MNGRPRRPERVQLRRTKGWRKPEGAVVVASSGLEDDGWEPLADESVTRVDLATRTVLTVPLSGERARLDQDGPVERVV